MKSIIQEDEHCCFVCGKTGSLEKHHCIYGTANRKQSEKYGLTVWLCPWCHRGVYGVHGRAGRTLSLELKKIAQKRFEAVHGDRDAFRAVFGKSYIDE